MITYFDTLSVPRKLASQSAEAYNQILCASFGKKPVTPDRKLAYIVLTQQYDVYVQIHCTKTLYDVIGVSKTAAIDDIKKAYRQLSLKVHPDRWMTADSCLQEQAVKNQARLSVAFQILSERRLEYDKAGCPYDLFNSSDDDDADDSDFNDDIWAASESEASESDDMESPPPPPKRGRTRGGSTRGRGGSESAGSRARGGSTRGGTRGRGSSTTRRGTNSTRDTNSAPPAADSLIANKVIVASLYQLYRGFTASVSIETSVYINDKWVLQTCQMQIPVPPRTAPGLIKVLKQAGVYRPGLHVREDVHISVTLDTASFSMRGQDIVINHNIDLDVAIRGHGVVLVRMPDNENEQFELSAPIHELQEVSYQGRGLKTLHTGFVGCIILRFHIVYPIWTKEQRFAVADFIQSISDM